jgi:hypothetical protein
MIYYTIIVTCAIAWIFLLLPSIVYLFSGWQTRFEMLRAVFDDKTLKLYFKKFFPSKKNIDRADLAEEFKDLFYKNHGKRHYIIPLIFLGLISAIGMLFTANSLFFWFKTKYYFKPIPAIALSAFLGAYMWVALDQLQRFKMRDFTSHDVCICGFRFLIAIPLGFSFSAIFSSSIGVTIAFLLGAFPAKTLLKYARRYVVKKMDEKNPEDEATTELENLQSINKEEAERYRGVGITNILQLAYSDPVDLTLRTNFDFNYVIDCISLALLWLYLGKNTEKLRVLGLRGAQEAKVLYECLNSDDADTKKMAEDNFTEIARSLGVNKNALLKTFFEVACDPYTEFINQIWN